MKMNRMWSIQGIVVALMFAALVSPAVAQTYGGSATGAAVTVLSELVGCERAPVVTRPCACAVGGQD